MKSWVTVRRLFHNSRRLLYDRPLADFWMTLGRLLNDEVNVRLKPSEPGPWDAPPIRNCGATFII